jgi:hypothetical protein
VIPDPAAGLDVAAHLFALHVSQQQQRAQCRFYLSKLMTILLICRQQATEAPAKEKKRSRAKSKERSEKPPKEKKSRHHRDRGALPSLCMLYGITSVCVTDGAHMRPQGQRHTQVRT